MPSQESRPQPQRRRILFITFPHFALIDLAGPAAVFTTANALLEQDAYQIQTLSHLGGWTPCDVGAPLQTAALSEVSLTRADTVLVVGAEQAPMDQAVADAGLTGWLREHAPKASRYGSVCLGAFLLGAAGLLKGRRVTTHWAVCDLLEAAAPGVEVEAGALYVRDDRLWTSAGVTTGIDMALAMVARDWGSDLTGRIAKRMVVYSRRPGNQSQFSTLLTSQNNAGESLADVLAYMEANLDRPLRVGALAEEAGMSERNFYRVFTAKLGMSPSRYLERLRLERAKQLLEAGTAVKTAASAVGWRSEAGFRAAFQKAYGISPSVHQKLHGGGV